MTINKKFERAVIRKRNRIEKRGQKMAFNAIKSQYKEVFDMVSTYSPKFVLDNLSVSKKPVQSFMVDYYQMFAQIGTMYRDNALRGKDEESLFFENVYMEQLRHYALTEAGARVTSITETTEKFIRGAIESAIQEGTEQGLGIDKISKLVQSYLKDSLGNIGRSRAKMIAQTEMITASNKAAADAVDSTGLEYRKFWSTSGLENTRVSHIHAQEAHPNGVKKGERFDMGDGTFMLHPGDPAGSVGNIVNCRCTLMHDIL